MAIWRRRRLSRALWERPAGHLNDPRRTIGKLGQVRRGSQYVVSLSRPVSKCGADRVNCEDNFLLRCGKFRGVRRYSAWRDVMGVSRACRRIVMGTQVKGNTCRADKKSRRRFPSRMPCQGVGWRCSRAPRWSGAWRDLIAVVTREAGDRVLRRRGAMAGRIRELP